jgi:S-adenosyl-L-methionine hydrolase (adenosine-forming)
MIVTLTSDLGNRDHYVASVKAAILSQAPQAIVVDISHEVAPFDIHEAAFLLKSVWQQFPVGTVHVIGINPELTTEQSHVVVHYMGHYFISADNGIFSILLEELPEDILEIDLPQGADWTFPMRGVFATAAAHLSKGGSMEFLGKRVKHLNRLLPRTPMIEDAMIKGQIEHIDHYGNCYTNITQAMFEQHKQGRRFTIQLKRPTHEIRKISALYNDVIEGERLAMWASNGYLLIAINQGVDGSGGGAAGLFGLHKGDTIRIEFYGDPNSEDDFQE